MYKRTCVHCNVEFETNNARVKACGRKCVARHARKRCTIDQCTSLAQVGPLCKRHHTAINDPPKARQCATCGQGFVSSHRSAKTCSKECSRKHENEQNRKYRHLYSPEKRAALVEYNRVWRKAHPEYHKDYNRKWRADNRERYLEYSRNYREANLEIVRERFAAWEAKNPNYAAIWAKRNPERAREKVLRRRANRRNAKTFEVRSKDLAKARGRAQGRCTYCMADLSDGGGLHWDHVVPLVAGGDHSIGNLVPACSRCNVSKGSFLLSEWRYRGLLSSRVPRRTYAA